MSAHYLLLEAEIPKYHNQYPPSNICLLLAHVSPRSPPSPLFLSLLMFSLLSVEKTLTSVSLVRKSTCPTHTEQNWADVTAAQHSPTRSHLYSQATAKPCGATKAFDLIMFKVLRGLYFINNSHIVKTNMEHLRKVSMTHFLLSCNWVRSDNSKPPSQQALSPTGLDACVLVSLNKLHYGRKKHCCEVWQR